jgi:C-terminal processing protease CtpA/Prc
VNTSYKSLPPVVRATVIGALCLLSLIGSRPTRAQSLNSTDRGRARAMLDAIKDSLKKNYYDQSYHGIDLDARFKAAAGKLEQAASLGQAFGIIAQVLMELEDSHTFFIPPARPASVEYGWQMQMVGDKCYVVAVRPGSDAEKQGLLAGDEVLAVDGRKPTRGKLWKMQYVYYTLRPQPSIVLTVQGPGGRPRELEVAAKVEQGKRILDLTAGRGSSDYWKLIREAQAENRLNRHRFYSVGTDLMVWKMPQFDLSDEQVDDLMGKARKHKALVLDLRGNPGGYVTSLERLVGHFFDREIKIADLKGRKELKPMVAKARGDGAFKGKLVVLVDSVSASAAELFARVVQLEGRGAVIGDRTAGAVMRSESHSFEMGTTTLIFYGASISDADVIMSDGKSLERAGVAPDETLTPSAAELAAKRDPVLARAVSMAGGEIDPSKAGALFPVEWKK